MAQRKNEAAWRESSRRWQIKVQADGERRTFNDSTPGKKGKVLCEQKADKWIENRTINENTKCDVLLDQFLERIKLTGGTSHYHTSESFIRLYIKPHLGARKVGKLTQADLQSALDYAYAGKRGKKLSAKTMRNIRATIMAFVKFCRATKCTQFHPETLTIPAAAKKSAKTILGVEDIITLFTVDTTLHKGARVPDRYIHAYRFLVVSGMRPGECVGLRNDDVKSAKVTIQRSINNYSEITDGKNENAPRVYMLDDHALSVLEDQRRMLMKLGQISPYVFPGENLDHVKQNRLLRRWKQYCQSNGITSAMTPYELRHTFVSVNTHMPDALKRLVMGHSENMDTQGIYSHEKAGDMEEAATYISAAFKEILGW